MANKVWTFELPGKWSDSHASTHTVELRQGRWETHTVWVDGRQMKREEMRSCTAHDLEEEYTNHIFEINGQTCWMLTTRSGFHDLVVDGVSIRTGERVPVPDLKKLCPPWFFAKRFALFLSTFGSAAGVAMLMPVSYPIGILALFGGYSLGGRVASRIGRSIDTSQESFLWHALLIVGCTILISFVISLVLILLGFERDCVIC